jgi:hypothetical protein
MLLDWLASNHSYVYAPLLATVFAFAGALWIGTLFSVSWITGCAPMMADGPEIGRLAVTLFRRWTVPSLWLALASGTGWVVLTHTVRARAHWAYLAAALAVLLLALHLAVGRRARRVVEGNVGATRGEGIRRLALMLSLGAVIAVVTFRAALVP